MRMQLSIGWPWRGLANALWSFSGTVRRVSEDFRPQREKTPTPGISILKEGRAGKRRWNRIYRNHANRPGGHPATGNPSGSDPANPVPQTVGSSLQPGCYESGYEPIRRTIAGFRHPYARRPKVRHSLSDARERFPSAGGISHRAHLWAGKRMGQECAGRRGERA